MKPQKAGRQPKRFGGSSGAQADAAGFHSLENNLKLLLMVGVVYRN
jgi:hypothetical protein